MPRSVAWAAVERDARVLAPSGGRDGREQAARPHVHAGVGPLGQRRRLGVGEEVAQRRVHVERRDEPPAVDGECVLDALVRGEPAAREERVEERQLMLLVTAGSPVVVLAVMDACLGLGLGLGPGPGPGLGLA